MFFKEQRFILRLFLAINKNCLKFTKNHTTYTRIFSISSSENYLSIVKWGINYLMEGTYSSFEIRTCK
ncbi:unnamed protein product [Meloidogyne enterolobii]|uniref:Uncharacterized protein n=1 Tax=Meloidogyne enterolobii TaxID=390850 RepID=A0ACB0YQB6_MELEN